MESKFQRFRKWGLRKPEVLHPPGLPGPGRKKKFLNA
jgi:hypothetical protein